MDSWKSRANKRRDARHTKDPVEVPKARSGKKDTKKWCKGKEGVAHTLKCFDYHALKYGWTASKFPSVFNGWKVLACTTCGKELETYMPFGKWNKKNRPDWIPTEGKDGEEKP